MARTARIFLTVMFLGGALLLPAARGQAPAPPFASPAPALGSPAEPTPSPAQSPASPSQSTGSPASTAARRPGFSELVGELPAPLPPSDAPALEGWEPEFLKTLPQPPDQPRSLMQPAPGPGPPPPDLERYFQVDPLLDPPQWRQRPGWFTNTQFDIIHPHLFFGMVRNGVVAPNGQFALVSPVLRTSTGQSLRGSRSAIASRRASGRSPSLIGSSKWEGPGPSPGRPA